MIKAGLFGAVIGLLYVMGLNLLSPFCTLCFTPLLGLSVGYLAANIDTPTRPETSLGRGSVAGAITSVGVLVGQILATLVNGILVTNIENLPALVNELGLPASLVMDPNQYWQRTLMLGSSCSVLNIMVIIGLAALGSQLWLRRQRRVNRLAA